MRDELVKLILSHQVLKIENESGPLFIWNSRKCVIGIFALQVSYQFCEIMISTKVFNIVCQCLPSHDGREVSIRFPVPSKKDG